MLNVLLASAALLSEPTSTAVTVATEPAAMHGTLLSPDGQIRAAAVIIPGSGPTDRNGDSPLGVSAAAYRLLAEALADQGIATLRYDKRGVGQSTAAIVAEDQLTFDISATDARLWLDEALAGTGLSCAWLIGHSEGALVALKAAEDNDPRICGLILVSGAGRRIGDVLREQLSTNLPAALRDAAFAALVELEAGRTTEAPPALAALFRPSVQPYLISWLTLDPARLAASFRGPMMIGQGSTDLQTTLTDAEALYAAQPNAQLTVWEGVNHVLKIAPADRTANSATYADPTLALAPGVAEDIAAFILSPR
ncbi:alpha/beta hydrolase [Brevundimonas sp.]|uniref:alpha/beta hydrolase n=1 Tax=Brevundimonas sp. TaxID=1871086 RepID=UPI0039194C49